MKVQHVKIKNFKGIDRQDLEVNGANVYVMGGNAKGKSSFIDAVFCQTNAAEPLKQGERKGEISVDFGEIKAVFKFDSKNQKPELTLFDAENKKIARPATTLDQLLGRHQFDVNSFLQKSNNERIKFLKDLCGINTDEFDREIKLLKEDIALGKKELKSKEAIVNDLNFDKDKVEKINILDVNEAYKKELAKKSERDGVIDRQAERSKRTEHIGAGIKELESKLMELNIELSEAEEKDAKSRVWLSENPDNADEISRLESEMEIAQDHNTLVDETLKCMSLTKELEKIEESIDDSKEKVKDFEEQRNDYIAENPFPVTGLELKEDELYYKGLPLESDQINTAELIIIGLQMQHKLSKEIKIARFDGSLLDKDNMELVENWAEKNGMQLFVELVDREANGLKIEVREVE